MASAKKLPSKLIHEFIHLAHYDKQLPKLKTMLEEHPELLETPRPGRDKETPLGAATHSGAKKVLHFLFEQGVQEDIFTACILRQYSKVEQFLDNDPKLITARAKHAHKVDLMGLAPTKKMVALLLARGYPMNLQVAASNGMIDQMKRILKESPDQLDAQDGEGATALSAAIWSGQDDAALYLLDRGARHDTGKDSRPLSWSSLWGRQRVATTLLETGVDISFMSFNYPYSYLHLCANWGHEGMGNLTREAYTEAILQIIRLLFKHGIDPSLTDKKGVTAHELCISNGFDERAALIEALS